MARGLHARWENLDGLRYFPQKVSIVITQHACLRCAPARQPSPSALLWAKAGGSGGARTRNETLSINGLRGLPSQGASQISGVLGHDLARVVTAWDKLPPPLKAAILALVNSATNEGGPVKNDISSVLLGRNTLPTQQHLFKLSNLIRRQNAKAAKKYLGGNA